MKQIDLFGNLISNKDSFGELTKIENGVNLFYQFFLFFFTSLNGYFKIRV